MNLFLSTYFQYILKMNLLRAWPTSLPFALIDIFSPRHIHNLQVTLQIHVLVGCLHAATKQVADKHLQEGRVYPG